MDATKTGEKFDWLVDLGGALAPGLSTAFAALKLAPSLAISPPMAMATAGSAGFGLGLIVMRLVRPGPRQHALAEFGVAPIEVGEESELLLDQRYEEPLLLTEVVEDEALLLDDRLVETVPGSRVVQLFASQAMPTPGQLKERIDRHLAGGPRPSSEPVARPRPDATGALYAALDDLRRSLR